MAEQKNQDLNQLLKIRRDKLAFSDRNNKNVRSSCDLLQILCMGVAYGHGSVFTDQEHCHRLSNDIASSDNNTFPAVDLNAGALEKLNNTRRCTGYEALLSNA